MIGSNKGGRDGVGVALWAQDGSEGVCLVEIESRMEGWKMLFSRLNGADLLPSLWVPPLGSCRLPSQGMALFDQIVSQQQPTDACKTIAQDDLLS